MSRKATVVRNCTYLVRNYLSGRLDLHEFGKELPYGKAGSGNSTNLVRNYPSGRLDPHEAPPRSQDAVRGRKRAQEGARGRKTA